MCALFRSSSSLNDVNPPRGLRKLFRKLRSKRSDSDDASSSSGSDNDDDVRILRPRDTIVTPIDRAEAASLLLSPRSRRAEMRRSRASM